jgi:hypothetical protein
MPKQPSQTEIDDLVRSVKALADEIAYKPGNYGELVRLARELQRREVAMPSGGHWYHEKGGAIGLKRLLRLHAPDMLVRVEIPQRTTEQHTLPLEPDRALQHTGLHPKPRHAEPPDAPKDSEAVPQFDPETARTLREVAQWWAERGKRMELVISRPRFRGKSVNSSFRVNGSLVTAALAKAREPQHRNRTGGNLSGLIELLLWQFLDCDPALLVPEP